MGSSLPHEPTRLEQLAELAGIDPDELRALLREEIEEAEHKLIQAVLAEARGGKRQCCPGCGRSRDHTGTTPAAHLAASTTRTTAWLSENGLAKPPCCLREVKPRAVAV